MSSRSSGEITQPSVHLFCEALCQNISDMQKAYVLKFLLFYKTCTEFTVPSVSLYRASLKKPSQVWWRFGSCVFRSAWGWLGECKQGPDLRYLRWAIWGRGFLGLNPFCRIRYFNVRGTSVAGWSHLVTAGHNLSQIFSRTHGWHPGC